jgi:hypothetical protein
MVTMHVPAVQETEKAQQLKALLARLNEVGLGPSEHMQWDSYHCCLFQLAT